MEIRRKRWQSTVISEKLESLKAIVREEWSFIKGNQGHVFGDLREKQAPKKDAAEKPRPFFSSDRRGYLR